MTDGQTGLRALVPGAARPRDAAHSVVLEWVEQQLRDGGLSVGDKLPAERALAPLASQSSPAALLIGCRPGAPGQTRSLGVAQCTLYGNSLQAYVVGLLD